MIARSSKFIAIPPGETIKEQLDFRNMSREEFSQKMNLSAENIDGLLKGRFHITSETASRLESVFGVPAAFWEGLENLYREDLLKVEEERKNLSRAVPQKIHHKAAKYRMQI